MDKREFLEKLKETLEADVETQVVRENIEYYSGYINEEVSKGRSEKEVMDELGDPWVIARTIIDAQGVREQGGYSSESSRDAYKRQNYQEWQNPQRRASNNNNVHLWTLDAWWKKLVLILGIVGVLFLVISIVAGIIRFVVPILIPVLLVVIVVKLFQKR